MKRSYRNTKLIKSLVLTFILSFSTQAAMEKGIVTNVLGKAFVMRKVNKKPVMTELKQGEALYEFDEVYTEVGSQISIRDNFDHDFHLSGSGFIMVMNRSIDLKGGYLWVRSYSDRDEEFHVTTVNSSISYKSSDFIASYNQDSGKTQVMTLKGKLEFSNSVHSYLTTPIQSGKFSFISESYENGAPRVPTPIGESTYRKVLTLFDGVDTEFEKVNRRKYARKSPAKMAAKRTPASADMFMEKKAPSPDPVPPPPPAEDPVAAGNIIYIQSGEDTTYKDLLIDRLQSQLKVMNKPKPRPKKFRPNYDQKSGVAVRVFGSPMPRMKKKGASRMPASVMMAPKKTPSRAPSSIGVKIKSDAFESSLIKEYKKQMRHSKEINSLINELKSYDQDYKESY